MTITSNPENPIFYVYVLLDTRKPGVFKYGKLTLNFEPFYVGKGKGSRITSHTHRSNNLVKNKINKIRKDTGNPHKAKILKSNLVEDSAYALEEKVISKIGRKDLGLGPLLNRVDGGRGRQQMYQSKKTKARRAATLSSYWANLTEEEYLERTKRMGRKPATYENKMFLSDLKLAFYKTAKGKQTRKKLSEAGKRQQQRYLSNPKLKTAITAKIISTKAANKKAKAKRLAGLLL